MEKDKTHGWVVQEKLR